MPASDPLKGKYQVLKQRLALQCQQSTKQDMMLQTLKGMTDGVRLDVLQQRSASANVMQQVRASCSDCKESRRLCLNRLLISCARIPCNHFSAGAGPMQTHGREKPACHGNAW